MCFNKVNLEMHIFLMICSNDNDSEQIRIALYHIIKVMFGNMSFNTIVIGKDKTKRITLIKVIKENSSYWHDEEIGRIQTKY